MTVPVELLLVALEGGGYECENDLAGSLAVILLKESVNDVILDVVGSEGAGALEGVSYIDVRELLKHANRCIANAVAVDPDELLSALAQNIPNRPVIRLCNFPNEFTPPRVSRITSAHVGRLVSIKGSVLRLGPPRPVVIRFAFVCIKCGARVCVMSPLGRMDWPSGCPNTKCRFPRFQMDKLSCEAEDWQRFTLQIEEEEFKARQDRQDPHEGAMSVASFESGMSDCGGGVKKRHGQLPSSIDVEVFHEDLVGSVCCGEKLEVVGVVRAVASAQENKGAGGSHKTIYSMFIEANTVRCQDAYRWSGARSALDSLKDAAVIYDERPRPLPIEMSIPGDPRKVVGGTKDSDWLPIHLDFIRDVYQSCSDKLGLLTASLCPQIRGRPWVKVALLLALVGGAPSPHRRSDIHLLIIGDPGLGKTQLLKGISKVATNSQLLSGTSSTLAGLTASVNKGVVEAGALVLCDGGGLCCIDELDKLGTQQASLLEAMEQQTVSVAKAAAIMQFPCRCSVVCAANPKGGRFDSSKTISENLQGVMSAALLSRFDAVFLVTSRGDGPREEPMQRRMEAFEGAELPEELLKVYLHYAKTYCGEVSLSLPAKLKLREFFLELRSGGEAFGSIPVTVRQLEAMIRLCEARAKLDLSCTATEQHAEEVIALLKGGALFEPDALLVREIMEEEGEGTTPPPSKAPKGKAKKMKMFLQIAGKEARKGGGSVTRRRLLEVAKHLGGEPEEMVMIANENGMILRQPDGTYIVED